MLVFLLSLVLGSEGGHIPTYWLLPYYSPAALQQGSKKILDDGG